MRLDKFLCDMGAGTRSEVKSLIKKGLVEVNGTVIKEADAKVKEETDQVALRGKVLNFSKFHYYLLHKPAGVITATEDHSQKTVMDLLTDVNKKNLFPVGRLDKDTEGLLLITDDGELAHRLLSPKKHVDKTYLVNLREPISKENVKKLEQGVDIGDDTPTMPARVIIKSDTCIELTIKEGRYHQVKRMLQAVGNEVVYLKRLSMGPLTLPDDLKKGEYRPLTDAEIQSFHSNPLKDAFTQFEAAIFDMDGTLLDSMWMWYAIDVDYLSRFGIEVPDGLQNEIEGMSFSETAVYFKERFQIPDSLEKIKADWNAMACDKYRYEVPFKEGALSFLQYCKAQGIKLGVATSNSRELVEHAAEAHSLYDYFDCIMTACEVNKGKPAPDIYLAVAEKLNVRPEKCLVFEDILPGIQAGLNAGMKVCAVEDEYSMDIRNEKCQLADYFIDSYIELVSARSETDC